MIVREQLPSQMFSQKEDPLAFTPCHLKPTLAAAAAHIIAFQKGGNVMALPERYWETSYIYSPQLISRFCYYQDVIS
jgi:hypothetical protein